MRHIWEKFRAALCISDGNRRTPLTLSPPDLAAGGGDEGGVGDGEDLLSALPDDVLLVILLRLPSTAAAARTSVLSRRWRRLWAHLPALFFPVPAPRRTGPRAALRARGARPPRGPRAPVPARRWRDADPVDSTAVLRLAAPSLTGVLIFQNVVPEDRKKPEAAEAGGGAAVELPCLSRAERIYLHLGYLRLALPPSGVLTKLTVLHLGHVRFQGACDVGNALSTARCPSLRELWLFDAQGVSSLAICSESLVSVKLHNLERLQQLTLESPTLREASVLNCFCARQPVADIYAPTLQKLLWADTYDPSTVQLGELAQLQQLASTFCFAGHGLPEYMFNWSTLMLLQRFQKIPVLSLLIGQHNMINCQYLMETITSLPDIENLCLDLITNGHAIGIFVFYFLKISTGIRRLDMYIFEHIEVQGACSPGCVCRQPQDWETEELILNSLQEVHINGLGGADYDIPFVKRLLGWRSVLKTVNISFSPSATVDEELCKELHCLAGPETCMKIYLYHHGAKVKYC